MKIKHSLFVLLFCIGCKKIDHIDQSPQKIEENSMVTHKGGSPFTTAQIDSVVNLYSKVGEVHNIGLDDIFTRLETIVDSAGLTPLITLEGERIFNESMGYLVDSLQVSTSFPFSSLGQIDSVATISGNSNTTFSDNIERVFGSKPSIKLQIALAGLENVIKDSTLNRDSANYNLLMLKVYDINMADSDKVAFAAALRVSQNSVKYWDNNHAKWDSLVSKVTNGTSRNVFGKLWHEEVLVDAAFADGKGAIIGALHGAYLGATVGTIAIPGIGTVGGSGIGALIGCVGGALIGSVGAALEGVLRHYFW